MDKLSAISMRGAAWLFHLLPRIKRQQKGAATAEYALILALVVVALIGVLSTLSEELIAQINDIVDQLKNVGT